MRGPLQGYLHLCKHPPYSCREALAMRAHQATASLSTSRRQRRSKPPPPRHSEGSGLGGVAAAGLAAVGGLLWASRGFIAGWMQDRAEDVTVLQPAMEQVRSGGGACICECNLSVVAGRPCCACSLQPAAHAAAAVLPSTPGEAAQPGTAAAVESQRGGGTRFEGVSRQGRLLARI